MRRRERKIDRERERDRKGERSRERRAIILNAIFLLSEIFQRK